MSARPAAPAERWLVVNADDFGRSPGINRGIIRAHQQGIVTSASLMVRWPAAPEAVALQRDHPRLSLGLHLDLCEWIFRDGAWAPVYEVVPWDDAAAVAAEVERQLDAFERLTGALPTHLDSHQHVHQREPVAPVALRLAERLRVPLRHFAPGVRYCGEFFGQTARGHPLPEAVGVDALLGILQRLPPGGTELACHPGEGDDAESVYGRERAEEVRTLCDPRVRSALASHRIQLRSFHDVAAAG